MSTRMPHRRRTPRSVSMAPASVAEAAHVFDPIVPEIDGSTFVSEIITRADRTEPLDKFSPNQLTLALAYGAEVDAAAVAHILAWARRANAVHPVEGFARPSPMAGACENPAPMPGVCRP